MFIRLAFNSIVARNKSFENSRIGLWSLCDRLYFRVSSRELGFLWMLLVLVLLSSVTFFLSLIITM